MRPPNLPLSDPYPLSFTEVMTLVSLDATGCSAAEPVSRSLSIQVLPSPLNRSGTINSQRMINLPLQVCYSTDYPLPRADHFVSLSIF